MWFRYTKDEEYIFQFSFSAYLHHSNPIVLIVHVFKRNKIKCIIEMRQCKYDYKIITDKQM